MMDKVDIDSARTELSGVEAGGIVVIERAGKPVARLVPIDIAEPRQQGLLRGLDIPDDVFAPLTDAEAPDWE